MSEPPSQPLRKRDLINQSMQSMHSIGSSFLDVASTVAKQVKHDLDDIKQQAKEYSNYQPNQSNNQKKKRQSNISSLKDVTQSHSESDSSMPNSPAQSTNHSTDTSDDDMQPINQSHNRVKKQSVKESLTQSTTQSIKQSVKPVYDLSVWPEFDQASVDADVKYLLDLPSSQSISQSINQPTEPSLFSLPLPPSINQLQESNQQLLAAGAELEAVMSEHQAIYQSIITEARTIRID